MKLDFHEKVVLITGGTSGIGLETARMFIAAGAKVAIAGRSVQQGNRAMAELEDFGTADFFPGDVSFVADCEKFVAKTLARFGRLDVLVNSAGAYLEKHPLALRHPS